MRRLSASLSIKRRPGRDRSESRPGSADEFSRLILPHLDRAYNFARYLTGDPDLSEDIVQDAVLRAFRSFGQFRGGSPQAWLLAIVRNCSRTAQAALNASTVLVVHENRLGEDALGQLANQADDGLTPEDEMVRSNDVAQVRSAIEAIPEPFREVVVLRDIDDLSYAEIAQVTGVPIGTVMSRLSRGRSMLANQLLPASTGERTTRKEREFDGRVR